MAGNDRSLIEATARTERGSRETRRMRKRGLVPGILYGRGRDPQAFSVNEREFRAALKAGHAVFDVSLGDETVPAMLKSAQHHPVRGGYTHLDLLQVDLTKTIQTTVPVELSGAEDAPGVIQGGVLDHVTRELNIEALPTEIPDSVTIDVSKLEINAVFTLEDAHGLFPTGLSMLDELDTVIATITPPTKVEAEGAIEEEIEVVGEATAGTPAAEEASEDGE